MRWSDVIGQERVVEGLARAVGSGRVPHAYLFEGPPGVGKRGAALGLALALNCAEAPGRGCGACETCRRIETGLHPDVPTFAPDGPQLVIEQAKAIVALAQSRPHEAAARVVIVDGADALNPSAANSLLKTLEEPAPRNHVVLCTSAPDRLLPTIRSRSQRVRFRALAEDALLRIAAAHGIERSRAEVAVALADGSAARMLAATRPEEGGASAAAWEAVAQLRAAVVAPGMTPSLDAASALASDKANKEAMPPLVALLARLYRDALVTAAGAPELALFAERARELAGLEPTRLLRSLGAIVEADAALLANVNPTLALERLLVQLRRRERGGRAS
ncbi:MAG TPA: DNA polymerase III subunit delta' [Polyangia bacterium]|jgi:DNA polymerase-3 subunit delta'|nr:DNA polymerase III subunit delta' [Polyangia bacterium]